MSFYNNNLRTHPGAVDTYLVENNEITGTTTSCHHGWEIIFGLNEAVDMELQVGGRLYDMSKTEALVYNGREPHRESYHRKNMNVEALVLLESLLYSLFRALDDE